MPNKGAEFRYVNFLCFLVVKILGCGLGGISTLNVAVISWCSIKYRVTRFHCLPMLKVGKTKAGAHLIFIGAHFYKGQVAMLMQKVNYVALFGIP